MFETGFCLFSSLTPFYIVIPCLAGELFVQNSLHDDIWLRRSECSCSSNVRCISHSQIEHHLVTKQHYKASQPQATEK